MNPHAQEIAPGVSYISAGIANLYVIGEDVSRFVIVDAVGRGSGFVQRWTLRVADGFAGAALESDHAWGVDAATLIDNDRFGGRSRSGK